MYNKAITFISRLNALVLRPSYRTHTHTHTHTTGSKKLRCQTPIKHTTNISEPLRISVEYRFIPPDDGLHRSEICRSDL